MPDIKFPVDRLFFQLFKCIISLPSGIPYIWGVACLLLPSRFSLSLSFFFFSRFSFLCLVFSLYILIWVSLDLSCLELAELEFRDLCLSSNLRSIQASFLQIIFLSFFISHLLGLIHIFPSDGISRWYIHIFIDGIIYKSLGFYSLFFIFFFLILRLSNLKWPVFKFTDAAALVAIEFLQWIFQFRYFIVTSRIFFGSFLHHLSLLIFLLCSYIIFLISFSSLSKFSFSFLAYLNCFKDV